MSNRQTISFLTRRFREAGIFPDTRHGQNFLVDLNLVQLLADSAQLERRDVVLEVGTGTGSLTALLAARAGAVVTVEISQELHQLASEELVDYDNVTLLHIDVLKNKNRFNQAVLDTIAQQIDAMPNGRLKLVANLPYNIATPVISNLLLTEIVPYSMTVTIQKELADRMTARPEHQGLRGLECVDPEPVRGRGGARAAAHRLLAPAQSSFGHYSPGRRIQPGGPRYPTCSSSTRFCGPCFCIDGSSCAAVCSALTRKQLGKSDDRRGDAEMEFGADARAEQLEVSELLALSEKIHQAVIEADDARHRRHNSAFARLGRRHGGTRSAVRHRTRFGICRSACPMPVNTRMTAWGSVRCRQTADAFSTSFGSRDLCIPISALW